MRPKEALLSVVLLLGLTAEMPEAEAQTLLGYAANRLEAINPATGDMLRTIGTFPSVSTYMGVSTLDASRHRYFLVKEGGQIRTVDTSSGVTTDSPFSAGSDIESIQWLPPVRSRMVLDFDGDFISDSVIFRPGIGYWYLLFSGTPGSYAGIPWGLPTDVPVPGDYDGDGRTDPAVWRPDSGTWYILPSAATGAYRAVQWGQPSDTPVPGDYDGDGKIDVAVWRPDTAVWYVLPSNAPGTFTSTLWGVPTDVPVPGDYDGDGRTDPAVWRPSSGIWYALSSRTGYSSYMAWQWGSWIYGDVPVRAR